MFTCSCSQKPMGLKKCGLLQSIRLLLLCCLLEAENSSLKFEFNYMFQSQIVGVLSLNSTDARMVNDLAQICCITPSVTARGQFNQHLEKLQN